MDENKQTEIAADDEVADDGMVAEEQPAANAANAANANDDPAANSDPAGASPEARVKALEAEVGVLKDQALRAVAEAENTRRRAERDKADASKYAIASFARNLLSVADNLGRALESAPDPGANDALKAFIEGIRMTEKELQSVFAKASIQKIEAMGARFDHNLHQAMFEVEDTSKPAGTVAQVLQTGYKLQDRLLRPAMVGVAKDNDESNPRAVNTVT